MKTKRTLWRALGLAAIAFIGLAIAACDNGTTPGGAFGHVNLDGTWSGSVPGGTITVAISGTSWTISGAGFGDHGTFTRDGDNATLRSTPNNANVGTATITGENSIRIAVAEGTFNLTRTGDWPMDPDVDPSDPADPPIDHPHIEDPATGLWFQRQGTGYALVSASADRSLSGHLEIPSVFNGLPVISIGYWVFFGVAELTSVSIPDSISSIGDMAFLQNHLTGSLVIPDSVTSIGDSAFMSNQLESVIIGNRVETIGDRAFAWNLLIGDLVIPDSVISIGNQAFTGQLENVRIGNRVETIGNGAFAWNLLTELVIPDSVMSIGDSAFMGNQLESVRIGNRVETIAGNVFAWNLLTELDIPDSVISIGNRAFFRNRLTGDLIIPDSVTSIGDEAFANPFYNTTNNLRNVIIGNNVASIGNRALGFNMWLESVTIPFASLEDADTAWGGDDWRYGILDTVTWIFAIN